MDPRYAEFIWASFGLAALMILWNIIQPLRQRRKIQRHLAELYENAENSENLEIEEKTTSSQ